MRRAARQTSNTGQVASPLCVSNTDARHLWLAVNGLDACAPGDGGRTPRTSPMDAAATIVRTLGLVQLDPLRPFARAHEHILWSRNSQLRRRHFERLIEERLVFEHFSHDACILPMAMWPCWQRQFERRAKIMERGSWGCTMPPADVRKAVLKRIRTEGPLSSRDFEPGTCERTGAWTKPPHKLALDWLWAKGQLAVSQRRGFIKTYDLTERVVPSSVRETTLGSAAQGDWLCRAALERLGTATTGELKRFWDVLTTAETRAWIDQNPDAWCEVLVEGTNGSTTPSLALVNIEDRLQSLGREPTRLRIINPFDPIVRDRARLSRLFGYDFRIEIYVKPDERKYGYYVCPILDGTRFIGRIELRAERDDDRLAVKGLWLEPGVRFGQGRQDRLNAELKRIARLGEVSVPGELPPPSW